LPRSKTPCNIAKARQLRRDMTVPEIMLWNLLRGSPDGVHFRRQHSIDEFVLDFYCAKAKVCIEIDGIAHDLGDRPLRDQMRDDWLRRQGIEVVRIPARDVLRSAHDVAESIVRLCRH
jgi:very-short-patch-repair endonuclease